MIFIFGLSENLDNDHKLFTKFCVTHFLRQLGSLSNDFMFGLSEKLIMITSCLESFVSRIYNIYI